jgi:lysophospholipase L1-like esterase
MTPTNTNPAATSTPTKTYTFTFTNTPAGGDPSTYPFEDGTTMSWSVSLNSEVTSITNSTTEAFLGTHSLAVGVSFNGSTGTSVGTQSPLVTNLAGKTITAHVWVPANYPVSGLGGGYIYIQSGTGWVWQNSAWVNFTPGAWNTLTFDTSNPAFTAAGTPDLTNVDAIGVAFAPPGTYAGSWTGTIYIDSVNITGGATPTNTLSPTVTNSPTPTWTPGGPTATYTNSPTITPTVIYTPGNANDPNILYFGRWDFTAPLAPTAGWGNCYIEANFNGTSLGVSMSDSASGYNYFTCSIDGGTPTTFTATYNMEAISLATGLANGTHSVLLERLTEGGIGTSTFGGFTLDTSATLAAPPARPAHKIEFIGDSITCGYSDEMSPTNSASMYENGWMAYGPQFARMVNAEVRTISKSGWGLYRNYGEALPPTQLHLPDVFPRTNFNNASPLWNFSNWQADAVYIALGTNDFSTTPIPTQSEWETAYAGFVAQLRADYPNAVIFCSEPVPSWVETMGAPVSTYIQDVVTQANSGGDSKVYYVSLNSPSALLTSGEFVGDNTHPTIAGHTIIANFLDNNAGTYINGNTNIRTIMGW